MDKFDMYTYTYLLSLGEQCYKFYTKKYVVTTKLIFLVAFRQMYKNYFLHHLSDDFRGWWAKWGEKFTVLRK